MSTTSTKSTIAPTQLAFYTLNLIGGLLALPLLLVVSIISRGVKKQPVLANLYFCFIFESITACLLLFAHKYSYINGHTITPRIADGSPLCVAQAVIFMPTPVLMSSAVFAVVLHIFVVLRSIRRSASLDNKTSTAAIIALPYVAYVSCLLPILIGAVKEPHKVTAHQFYCTLDKNYASFVSGAGTAVFALSGLVLQVWMGISIFRHHRTVVSRRNIDVSLFFRLGLFMLFMIVAVILSISTALDFTAVAPDIIVSTSSLVMCLVFGTRQETLHAWYAFFTNPASTFRAWLAGSTHHSTSHNSTGINMNSFGHSGTVVRGRGDLPTSRNDVGSGYYVPRAASPVTGRPRAREMQVGSGWDGDIKTVLDSSRMSPYDRGMSPYRLPSNETGDAKVHDLDERDMMADEEALEYKEDTLDYDAPVIRIERGRDSDERRDTFGSPAPHAPTPPSPLPRPNRAVTIEPQAARPQVTVLRHPFFRRGSSRADQDSHRAQERSQTGSRISPIVDMVSPLTSVNVSVHHTISFDVDPSQPDDVSQAEPEAR